MKVTVEVDCTPEEARIFFGLPDVQPMQTAVMASLEKQMLRGVEGFSPESVLRLWFTTMPQLSANMQDMFARMMGGSIKG